ncbi:MAG: hypothetical protein WDN00_01630 [Limisphaerales bacterium]
MQEHKLVRQGQAPLNFNGEIIGKGEIGNEQSGVTIRIYRTKGNLYVAEIERRNSRSPFNDVPAYRNAAHAKSPADVIDWLKEGEETLGKASQDAVEKACENDKEFAAAWVERIE